MSVGGPIAWDGDQMSRKGVAEFLTAYLDSNEKIKVLNINAPWGAGKTFFVENWIYSQCSGRACVYFNAWENDFTGDPFVSLVSVIRDQLIDAIGATAKADVVVKDFTSKAAKAIVAAGPVLAKGLVKKLTGTDASDLIDSLGQDALGEAAEKAVENLIVSNREAMAIVKDFKKVFSELLVSASMKAAGAADRKPVYVFIDELDRCRPTFSIELLERLKHLFDAPECKFIIATDTVQLAEAIKAVYGSGFNSRQYLKRFFDAEFALDNSNFAAWVKVNFMLPEIPPLSVLGHSILNSSNSGRLSHYDVDPIAPDSSTVLAGPHELNEHQVIFLALVEAFGPEIRDLESIVMKINAMQPNVKSREFHFLWGAYLIFLKEGAPDLYHLAVRGEYNKLGKEIKERFNDKKLYFVTSNRSVHEVFAFYLNLYRSGSNEARNIARSLGDDQPSFMDGASLAFCNEYEAMAGYINLVDLSHSIK